MTETEARRSLASATDFYHELTGEEVITDEYKLSHEMRGAIAELQALILKAYPDATFTVTDGEETGSVHLCPTVDVIETDPVLDLVMDRVLAFQEEKGLDIHVIPLRTPRREAELQERIRKEVPQHVSL